jgi:hypothetical protein
VSKADDGARPPVNSDTGITSHGVCRASTLRPGQRLRFRHRGKWIKLITVEVVDGKVLAKSFAVTWTFAEADIVPVRDILHTYTESETP